MCPSRARVFGVPASPYRLRLRPCLGSGVVERVVCGAGLSLGCLTGLVRSAVGGPSQPRPARESRRGFAHRFDLSTLPRFTRLRRAPRLMHGETPFTAYQKRVGSQAGARGSSSLPRSGRTAVTGLSSPAAAARALRPLVLSAGSCAPGVSRLLPSASSSQRAGRRGSARARESVARSTCSCVAPRSVPRSERTVCNPGSSTDCWPSGVHRQEVLVAAVLS